MLNFQLISKPNRITLPKIQIPLISIQRYLNDPCHYEPKELKWQWEVRKDPEMKCPDLCVTKCPKKRFFPRVKKQRIPKEIKSCPEAPEKKMTWKEYFSYLLPDSYTTPKPPLTSCRKLMRIRREKCLDPYSPECLRRDCYPLPLEWKGQGVIQAAISCSQPAETIPQPKPCPPPQHSVPRCVMVKKGLCPLKGKAPPSLAKYELELDDLRAKPIFSPPEPKPFKLRCTKACRPKIPPIHDKSAKLACRYYAQYKTVECPKQLFTRYKSVDVPPGTHGELRTLKPIPAGSFKLKDVKLNVKKGVCQPPKYYAKSDVRSYHTEQGDFVDFPEPPRVPSGKSLKPDHFAKSIIDPLDDQNPPIKTKPVFDYTRNKNGNFKVEFKILCENKALSFALGKEAQSYPRSTHNSALNSVFDLIGRLTRGKTLVFNQQRLISTNSDGGVRLKDCKRNKDEEDAGCSGCMGVTDDTPKIKKALNCTVRRVGKCRCAPRERGPDEEPIRNPYYDHKDKTGSPCQVPRYKPCPPKRREMPCDSNKKKYHTYTAACAVCSKDKGCYALRKRLTGQTRYSQLSAVDTDSLAKSVLTLFLNLRDELFCYCLPAIPPEKGPKEKKRPLKEKPRNVSLDIARSKSPKKLAENEPVDYNCRSLEFEPCNQKKGLLCRLASFFGIGCGARKTKKKQCS